MNRPDFVYVYVPEFASDEIYVFESQDDANVFARAKGYEPSERVREEPIFFADDPLTREIIDAVERANS